MRLPRRLAGLLLSAGLALAACAISPLPFVAGTSRTAAVVWRNASGVHAGHVDFQSGVGLDLRLIVRTDASVLTLTRSRGEWTAVGPLAGRGWRGPENAAPPALLGWFSLAEAWEGAATVADGDTEVRTGRISVRYLREGGELSRFELVSVTGGERFRVSFN